MLQNSHDWNSRLTDNEWDGCFRAQNVNHRSNAFAFIEKKKKENYWHKELKKKRTPME